MGRSTNSVAPPFINGKVAVYKYFCCCYSNVPTAKTKELFVLTANTPLVDTSISIGDVNDIFAI